MCELAVVFSRGSEVLKDGDWVWVQNEIYNRWTLAQIEEKIGQFWRIPVCELNDGGALSDAYATDCLKQSGRVEQAVVKIQRMWKKYWQRRAADALLAFVLMLANKRRHERQSRGTEERHEVRL